MMFTRLYLLPYLTLIVLKVSNKLFNCQSICVRVLVPFIYLYTATCPQHSF